MLRPDNKPKKGLVRVKFLRDFAGYGVKRGDEIYVSPSAAKRLLEKYQIIAPFEMPVAKAPEPEPEKPKTSGPIMVRVVRSLVSKLGTGWYPNSVHLADPKLIEPYLQSGEVVADQISTTDSMSDPEPAPSPYRYEKHMPNFQWYASHPEWKRQSIVVAMRAIELAFQVDADTAYDTLLDWASDGKIDFKDEDVLIL